MKKLFSALIVVFGLAGGLGVYSQQAGANISFTKMVHDFGQIKEDGGTVSHDFKFTNTGSVPLIIQNVKASCGCTSPSWTKDPIIPGKEGFIKATFNPTGRPGTFSKTVSITSNSKKPVTVLTIKGEVLQKEKSLEDIYRHEMGLIRVKAKTVAFPRIYNNQTEKRDFEIYNPTKETVKISFENVPDHVTISPSVINLAPGQEGKFVFIYDAAKKNDWSYVRDYIYLQSNDKFNNSNRIIITANIQEDFSSLTPAEKANAPKVDFENEVYNFGSIQSGEKVDVEFTFTNKGKTPLIIRKVKAACGCTAVYPHAGTIAPGESSSIKASFNSRGRKGKQRKTITVITNDPESATVILRLTGEVK